MRSIKDFIKYEFIGLRIEVYESKIKSLEGIYGEIIYETKNVFYIETENGVKIVPKKISKFIFYYNDYIIFLDGSIIDERPWDRIKIRIRKKL